MSGVTQAVFMNQRSFGSIQPTPPGVAVGDAYEGGFYAGAISTTGNGVATHYLVVAPLSSGQTNAQWKTTDTSSPGTSSIIDGPTNSSNMNDVNHPAAQFCEGLTIGGFSDWYMPAKNELDVCYFNLKPDTTANSTSSGTNANAVPIRTSNYTSSNPARTSATAFIAGGAEAFSASSRYWSSTELTSTAASNQTFDSGFTGAFLSKTNTYTVRAVRRVPV